MNAEMQMDAFPPVPQSLGECIAIDRELRQVLVDPKRVDDVHFLTWLDRCRASGIALHPIPTELDVISKARQNGGRVAVLGSDDSVDVSLKTRGAALELLAQASRYRASDIHILMKGTHAEVQFRIKGELRVAMRLPQDEAEGIVRAFYQGIAVVKAASYIPLDVQNAQISGEVLDGTSLSSVRIVRGPSYPVDQGGGFMVLRLQYRGFSAGAVEKHTALPLPRTPAGRINLEAMGYTAAQAARQEHMQDASSGIVIYTGPTGSGKTTTINEMSKQRARLAPGRRQIAIEEPIEYPQEWAVQMVISNSGVENMFAQYLRAALRMDPDDIFFGEIRDPDCGVAVYEAALTGHFIRTTMHTPDAFTVPARLEIMDRERLPPRLTCDSKLLRGITAQRLVPRLCPHCSVKLIGKNESKAPRHLWEALITYGDLSEVRIRGEGCPNCSFDGLRDRVVIAEVVQTDSTLMADFINHGTDVARRNFRARFDTDNSILDSAMRRVLVGEVDPLSLADFVDTIVPFDQVNQ